MKRKPLPDQGGGPVRTCLGCGARFLKKKLLRFGAGPDGLVAVDKKSCLPGRGVYCCPNSKCLTSFLKKKGKILRTLRVTKIDCGFVLRLVGECRLDIADGSN